MHFFLFNLFQKKTCDWFYTFLLSAPLTTYLCTVPALPLPCPASLCLCLCPCPAPDMTGFIGQLRPGISQSHFCQGQVPAGPIKPGTFQARVRQGKNQLILVHWRHHVFTTSSDTFPGCHQTPLLGVLPPQSHLSQLYLCFSSDFSRLVLKMTGNFIFISIKTKVLWNNALQNRY